MRPAHADFRVMTGWMPGPDSSRPTSSCCNSLAPESLPEMNHVQSSPLQSPLHFPSQQVLTPILTSAFFFLVQINQTFPTNQKTLEIVGKTLWNSHREELFRILFWPLKILWFLILGFLHSKKLLWKLFLSDSPTQTFIYYLLISVDVVSYNTGHTTTMNTRWRLFWVSGDARTFCELQNTISKCPKVFPWRFLIWFVLLW